METRRQEFARNPALESLLGELSSALAPAASALAAKHPAPQRPVVLIVGTPRSGSTLLMQWLAASGGFSYPTNLIARFWRAPAVGAMVDRLLFDATVDFRGETRADAPAVDFRSELGKTRGPRAPNEFWYLWRNLLGFGDPPVLGVEGRARADVAAFQGALGAWEAVAGRPIAMKAMIADWEIPFIAEILPTAIFLDLRRSPEATMASLLDARVKFAGTVDAWYSFRPPVDPGLLIGSPEEQVAVQVRAMRLATEAGLATLPPERVIGWDHEAFCADPGALWARLAAATGAEGAPHLAPFAANERQPTDRVAAAWARAVSLL